jgi:hypothetical protein
MVGAAPVALAIEIRMTDSPVQRISNPSAAAAGRIENIENPSYGVAAYTGAACFAGSRRRRSKTFPGT